MKEGRGLVVVSAILEGDIDDHTFVSAGKVRQAAEQLQTEADESGIHGFAEVTVARNRFDGFCSVCQLSGLGSFKPNCVILSWPSSVRYVARCGTGASARAGGGILFVSSSLTPSPRHITVEVCSRHL